MGLSVEKVKDVAVVQAPLSYLDASNVSRFKEEMAPIAEQNSKIVLDMRELQFVDSSGLGAILSCLKKLNASGGDLKLCWVSEPVRVLLEMVRMHRIIDIFDNREDAIRSFE